MRSRNIIVLLLLSVMTFLVLYFQSENSLQFPESPRYGTLQFIIRWTSIHVRNNNSSISRNSFPRMTDSGQLRNNSRQINGDYPERYKRSNIKDTTKRTSISVFDDIPYSGPCSVKYCTKDTIVDCAGLSLTEVRSTWFPRNTTIVLLDNNDLEVIDNVSFSHLNELRVLSLSNNKIKHIQQNAFRGLEHLETLNLEYNRLTEDSYPPGVFDPLVSLTDLRLRFNKENSNLPDSLFTHLKNLNSLTIDANGDTFSLGKVFSNLTKLVLSGNVKILDAKSFENVQQITHLFIENLPSLSNFTDTALEPLHNLDNFTLSGVFIGISNSLNILKPLVGRNMTSIGFHYAHFSNNEDFSTLSHNEGILYLNKTKYAIQICVRDFSFTVSTIYGIYPDAFFSPTWNLCLKNLDFSRNPLKGTRFAFLLAFNLRHVESVNLSGAIRACYTKESFSNERNKVKETGVSFVRTKLPSCDHDLLWPQNNVYKYDNRPIGSNVVDVLHQKQNNYKENRFVEATNEEDTSLKIENTRPLFCSKNILQIQQQCSSYFIYYFSSSVKHVRISNLFYSTYLEGCIVVVGGNNLVSVDARDNELRSFTAYIAGFDSLQTFMLSGNDLSTLAEYFFDQLCNLRELDLSNCRLNTDFVAQQSARITQKLGQLKRLDLSSNLLYSLQPGTFAPNKMLQDLDLSKNRFKTIPFSLKDTPNLKWLDLSENSLPSLETVETDELDKLANQPGGFDLFISGNVLSCGCDSLRFLHWLSTTRVRVDIVHNFTCMNNEGQLSYWSISYDLEELWRKCWGETFLSVALILLFSMGIGFLSVFVIWKNKTFLWTKLLEIVIGYKQKRREDYQIGVFIGYADKDYNFPCLVLRKFIEDELHLTTYVSHRDMDPSCDVANSIVDAINASWRTVIVCTDNFLSNDEWSMFTLRSSIYALSPANPARMLVLVHENLEHRLPAEVVSAIPEDNILVVSDWTMSYSLRETLKTHL